MQNVLPELNDGYLGINQYFEGEDWVDILGKVEKLDQEGTKFFLFLYEDELHDPYISNKEVDKVYVEKEVEEIPNTLEEFYSPSKGLYDYVIKELEKEVEEGNDMRGDVEKRKKNFKS